MSSVVIKKMGVIFIVVEYRLLFVNVCCYRQPR
jgi:hypothetical protein